MRSALIAVVVAFTAATAGATPSEDLAKAREAFRNGQFEVALPLFNVLLYPELQLASADELVEAHIGLAVCLLEGSEGDKARLEFEKAIQLDPNKQLDPGLVSKEAIRLFDDTKAEIRNRADREAAKKRAAEERAKLLAIRASLVGVRENTFAYNFVPFGAGQFQNKQYGKGALFLTAETITFGTSLAVWTYLVRKYGIDNQHLHVPTDEATDIRLLQQIEIGTGVAFLGLWVWGAVDAYRNYKAQTRVKVDESLMPPELRDLDKPKPKPKKPAASLRLVPMITPDGGGIGLGWEN